MHFGRNVAAAIVECAVYDRFLELFVAAAKKLKVGDPEDGATDVGPMVSSAAADRVEAMISDAVAKGGKLVLNSGAPRRHSAVRRSSPRRRPAPG